MAVLQDQVQAKVLLRVYHPEVTSGSKVKDQPALLCSPDFSLVQQQQLHFTEERIICNYIIKSRLIHITATMCLPHQSIGFQWKYSFNKMPAFALTEISGCNNISWMQHHRG